MVSARPIYRNGTLRGVSRNRLFVLFGVIGVTHLFIQTVIRVYVFFNPFTPYIALVNVFSTYCYLEDNRQKSLDPAGYQDVVKHAQLEYESYQSFYSSNVRYSADWAPSRTMFSFERALVQPLIEKTLEHHGLSSLTSKVTEIISEPFNGFGNLYHLLVQKSNRLIKLSTFLPASEPVYLPTALSSKFEHVNLIVTYSREPTRLKNFLDFIRILMNIDRSFSVVLVNFVAKHSDHISEERFIYKSIASIVGESVSKSRFKVLSLVGPFSRGQGLNYGARNAKCPKSNHSFGDHSCTLFFCDIDVTFTQEMLNRCRLLSETGKSAYFPIVFSQYNPKYSKIHMAKFELYLSGQSGLWRTFGYGMSCLKSSDFQASIAFPEYTKWGSEDEDFHARVKSAGLAIYRMPDPGLVHAYHSKNCSSADNKFSCFKSQALTEGNSEQLGLELFKLKEKYKLI